MKPQSQDWTTLADLPSAPSAGSASRSERSAPSADSGAASGAVTPPAGARQILLALPFVAIAVFGCGLLAAQGGAALRGALAGGAVLLALLLPFTLYARREARERFNDAAAVRRQLANILGSLHEGLFLIGRDLRLSTTGSASMREMLRLGTPAARRFEDVLRALLLDEETLAAAVTFLQLLWADQADEQAIETLNPLSQVEVSFANSRGGSERRFLSFSFRRVSGSRPADDAILGMVSDVTGRVLMARELEQAQADADSQVDLLLELVRADPLALVAFLDDADEAFRKSNAILSASAIGQPQLHRKLMGVLQQMDAITAEAEALSIASFSQRLRGIDAVLTALCARTSLIGNDFLPAVVRLDELMNHAATMRSIHQHIVLLRAASAALAAVDERAASRTAAPAALGVT